MSVEAFAVFAAAASATSSTIAINWPASLRPIETRLRLAARGLLLASMRETISSFCLSRTSISLSRSGPAAGRGFSMAALMALSSATIAPLSFAPR